MNTCFFVVMNSRDIQHAERRDKNVQEETENISGSPPSSEGKSFITRFK